MVQNLILKVMLNLIMMRLSMTVVVIHFMTLLCQNIGWMLGNLEGHHLLNGCRIPQIRIKL